MCVRMRARARMCVRVWSLTPPTGGRFGLFFYLYLSEPYWYPHLATGGSFGDTRSLGFCTGASGDILVPPQMAKWGHFGDICLLGFCKGTSGDILGGSVCWMYVLMMCEATNHRLPYCVNTQTTSDRRTNIPIYVPHSTPTPALYTQYIHALLAVCWLCGYITLVVTTPTGGRSCWCVPRASHINRSLLYLFIMYYSWYQAFLTNTPCLVHYYYYPILILRSIYMQKVSPFLFVFR